MGRCISAFVLFSVHILSRLFYRIDVRWVGDHGVDPWRELKSQNLRVIAFLHHTSLFEPIFTGGVPLHFLWFMAGRILVPGADKTLQRPIVGTFYKLLTPAMVPISRKRDASWDGFLSRISEDTIVMLAPEGRMMRRNGLDSKGQPMSVRGGIGEILQDIPSGKMLLCYSSGLHHIQSPGERFPRIFQTARITYEIVDIAAYKRSLAGGDAPLKLAVAKDLEARLEKYRWR
ncbi:hypothetical protein K2X33_11085 [bacterium]|nr:hypothetical protein [bacterium]